MAGDAKKLQPIIVKKIKKGGHAAHGGAWKIAYADFVTAMMAFFLLMWLLGSTTEGDRKGIQDYFSNPVKVSLMGGAGSGESTSILVGGGGRDQTETAGHQKRNEAEMAAAKRAADMQAVKAHLAAQEQKRLRELRAKVEEKLEADPRLAEMKKQIRLDMTPDGLRIQIVDEQNRPMFASGSAVVQPYMRELLRTIGNVLAEVPNKLTLEGHTDSTPFGSGSGGYSNWELSADRANASRRELLAGGLSDLQMLRVQGLAASSLFDRDDPANPINRRISIIVMNREAEDRFFRAARTEPDAPPALDIARAAAEAASSAPEVAR
jgi:chemotaxis protein MotB